jgi:hypothetical protein
MCKNPDKCCTVKYTRSILTVETCRRAKQSRQCILSDKWHAPCDHDQRRSITISTNVALLPDAIQNSSNERPPCHPPPVSHFSLCWVLHRSIANNILYMKTMLERILQHNIRINDKLSEWCCFYPQKLTVVEKGKKTAFVYGALTFVTAFRGARRWPAVLSPVSFNTYFNPITCWHVNRQVMAGLRFSDINCMLHAPLISLSFIWSA